MISRKKWYSQKKSPFRGISYRMSPPYKTKSRIKTRANLEFPSSSLRSDGRSREFNTREKKQIHVFSVITRRHGVGFT